MGGQTLALFHLQIETECEEEKLQAWAWTQS